MAISRILANDGTLKLRGDDMRSVAFAEADTSPLNFHEALASPCSTCQSTPCCQNLPLQTFAMSTVADVDYAVYLLNFDNIELGVAADGTWSAYYRQSCRFLDPNTLGCGLHGTADKPHVCVQYNPFSCFYRRALSPEGSADYLRVDRARLQTIAESFAFDSDRRIIAAPTIDSLVEFFADQPILDDIVPSAGDPVGHRQASGDPPDLADPCGSCQAYCCSTLMFPISPPVGISALDYLRFALGFPGTEIVVTDSEWHLALATRCRHLESGGSCGVFGSPARPLRCQFYDAWACSYRAVFAGEGAATTVRIRLEEFPALAEACKFNADGSAAIVPTAPDLRPGVSLLRANGAAPVARPAASPGINRKRLLPLAVVSHAALSASA